MSVPLIPVTVSKTIAAAGNYDAGDILSESATVGTVWTFDNMAPADGFTGFIYHALIKCSEDSIACQFRLHLFSAAPSAATAVNDGAALANDNDDRALYLGAIDFEAMKDVGEFSMARALGVYYPYRCADGANTLYAILETLNAETGETAGMVIDITLTPAANPF